MGGFNRDRSGGRGGKSFGGGGRSFGRPSFGGHGGRDRGDRPQMYKAICAECGDNCEVPFKPSGDKPVLCRDCFKGGNDRAYEKPRGEKFGRNDFGRGDTERNFERNRNNDRQEDYKVQFEMLNAKLDKILKLITPQFSVSKEQQAEVEGLMEKAERKASKKVAKKAKQEELN